MKGNISFDFLKDLNGRKLFLSFKNHLLKERLREDFVEERNYFTTYKKYIIVFKFFPNNKKIFIYFFENPLNCPTISHLKKETSTCK